MKDGVYLSQIKTPMGAMLAGATSAGICLLEFLKEDPIEEKFDSSKALSKNKHIEQLQKEIDEYFSGERNKFDVQISPSGTLFQQTVWKALNEIPYGKTKSYKEQALAIENPKAIRAVAKANGENKILILIPCHRVIGSDGSLTGYAGGLDRKQFLLNLEESNHLNLI